MVSENVFSDYGTRPARTASLLLESFPRLALNGMHCDCQVWFPKLGNVTRAYTTVSLAALLPTWMLRTCVQAHMLVPGARKRQGTAWAQFVHLMLTGGFHCAGGRSSPRRQHGKSKGGKPEWPITAGFPLFSWLPPQRGCCGCSSSPTCSRFGGAIGDSQFRRATMTAKRKIYRRVIPITRITNQFIHK